MQDLRPDLYLDRLDQLDFSRLAAGGRVHVCLDLDNTLALRDAWEPAEGVAEHLARARREGHVEAFCLVSNVIWGRGREARVAHFARLLGLEHHVAAMFWDRKPSPKPFLRAMERMGATPGSTAVVGDQLFTDVAGGRRLGLYTVLVKPLGPDHWTTLLSTRRRQEARILRALGLIPREETQP